MAAVGTAIWLPSLVSASSVAVSGAKFYSWIPTSAGAATASPRTLYTDPECLTEAANPYIAGTSGQVVLYKKADEAVTIVVKSADAATTYNTVWFGATLGTAIVADGWDDILSLTNPFVLATQWLDNTGSSDNASALQTMVDWLADQDDIPTVFWPAGTYSYSLSPNFAIQNAKYIPLGEVRLIYTGTEDAVTLSDLTGIYDVTFGTSDARFIIMAPSTAKNGMYVKGVHHSTIGAICVGCGTAYSGFKIATVCTEYYIETTPNIEGWYNSGSGAAVPLNGVAFVEDATYNILVNPKMEGVTNGFRFDTCGGNIIKGGTGEGCTTYGARFSSTATGNRFVGTDFESNTTADILFDGVANQAVDCDTLTAVTFNATSKFCKLVRGLHKAVTFASGSFNCIVEGIQYDRQDTGGTITNSGLLNTIRDITKGASVLPEGPMQRIIQLRDHFIGRTINTQKWQTRVGSGGGTAAILTTTHSGLLSLATGNDAAVNMAANGVLVDAGVTQWYPGLGEIVMDVSFSLDSIANIAFFIGLTDQVAALEMPFTLGGSDALTSNATDGVGFLFDTAADTDHWWAVGVKADVDATKVDVGAPGTVNVGEIFRMVVLTDGSAKFYRSSSNSLLATVSNAVTPGMTLTPVIAGFSRATAVKTMNVDYIDLTAKR